MLDGIVRSSADTAAKPAPVGCPVPWEPHSSPRSEVVLMLDPLGQYEFLNDRGVLNTAAAAAAAAAAVVAAAVVAVVCLLPSTDPQSFVII